MYRVFYTGVLVLLLTACSRVQFAYNQLDWLIPYYVNKQAELNESQNAYLEQSVDYFLDWHCGTQLEAYAVFLQKANSSFQSGMVSERELREFLKQIDAYWYQIKLQAYPAIAHLLLTLSDSQVNELFASLEEKNSEWLARFNEQSNEERRLDYQENMTRELERWFGPLKLSQKKAVDNWSRGFEPLGIEGLEMRQQWQRELRKLLDHTESTQAFYSGIEQLFVQPSSIYSEKYLTRLENNTNITITLIVMVAGKLDEGQLQHLARKIGSLSRDFVQLACVRDSNEHQTDLNFSMKLIQAERQI